MGMFHKAALFLNDDMYHEFKIALALGRWRSGARVTPHQRKICQEVVSIREAYQFQQPETFRMLQDKAISEFIIEHAYIPSNTIN